VWVIQGEEEIGSPWAHALFPELELPPIELWLEETGYFEEDGVQRVLARRIPPRLASVLERVEALAGAAGHRVRVLDRYLNKAFGESRCPCLTHLVMTAPYLAIGPNDTRTRIHAPDESLPLNTLELSQMQLISVLHEVARCA
jgi:acetylornithine deacetylase/succinyl-diaminopimelate desuccinylase-like protein